MEIIIILIIVVPVVAYSSVRIGRDDSDNPSQRRTLDSWARDAQKDRDNG